VQCRRDIVDFTLELYNIPSALHNVSGQDTQSKVNFLAKDVKDYTLPVFTGKSKCPTPNDGGDEPGPSICPKCGRGGATEQLET
jgi:hypothetical protein